MLLGVGLVAILISLIFYYVLSLKLYWINKKVPYAGAYTLIDGIKALVVQFSFGNLLWKVYNRSDPKDALVGFHLLGKPSVLIKDVELIKRILIKDFENFSHRTIEANHQDDPVGTRIMTFLRSRAWVLLRRKFSRAFTTKKFHLMYPRINHVVDNMVNYFAKSCDNKIDGRETFRKFASDFISLTAFGIKTNCFEDDNAISIRTSRAILRFHFYIGVQLLSYFLAPLLAKLLRMRFIPKLGVDIVKNTISDIRAHRKENNIVNDDFVGTIIDMLEKKTFTEDENEIYGQGIQIWLAGVETIGLTTLFLFYELGHNQEIQEKLREEVLATLGNNNGHIPYETLQQMNYLRMTINESLRKYPILPFLDRRCINKYTIPGTDIVIDAGTNVYISIQGIHSNPVVFSDPFKFDPNRGIPGNPTLNETFQFLSFGAGPRHCIGLRYGKLAVMMATLKVLSKFRIHTCGKYNNNMEYGSDGFLLISKRPISFRFEKL